MVWRPHRFNRPYERPVTSKDQRLRIIQWCRSAAIKHHLAPGYAADATHEGSQRRVTSPSSPPSRSFCKSSGRPVGPSEFSAGGEHSIPLSCRCGGRGEIPWICRHGTALDERLLIECRWAGSPHHCRPTTVIASLQLGAARSQKPRGSPFFTIYLITALCGPDPRQASGR